jgi:hypothetical protein
LPVIPALGRLTQEDLELEASLSYIGDTITKKQKGKRAKYFASGPKERCLEGILGFGQSSPIEGLRMLMVVTHLKDCLEKRTPQNSAHTGPPREVLPCPDLTRHTGAVTAIVHRSSATTPTSLS